MAFAAPDMLDKAASDATDAAPRTFALALVDDADFSFFKTALHEALLALLLPFLAATGETCLFPVPKVLEERRTRVLLADSDVRDIVTLAQRTATEAATNCTLTDLYCCTKVLFTTATTTIPTPT